MRYRRSRAQRVVLLALLSLVFIEVPVLINRNPVRLVSQSKPMTGPEAAIKQNGAFAVASDEVYIEDFTSTAYMDAANTNASGWGSGGLRLPHATPYLAGSCATPGFALGVYVDGDYAYVAAGSGLRVVNTTDPTHPTLVGSSAFPGSAYGVYVSGDYAYVAASSGLQAVNITDPTHPTLAGSCATPDDAFGVYVSGDFAYVAAYSAGLQVVNIADPTHPTLAGSCATPSSAYGVYVSGDYAYVGAYSAGLQVVNIADPTHPTLASSCATPDDAFGVHVSGDFAYVAAYSAGLQVVNITDPTHPSLAGSCATPDFAFGVHVSGDYAYAADWDSGLQVVNITDPTHPSICGSCATADHAYGVYASGDYAYVADWASGLQVIKIADLIHPYSAGSCDTPGTAYDVYVSGDYAYVADYVGGLQVVNITDPTRPSLAGSCYTLGNAYGVYVSGDYAYVAGPGLQVVNITDPTHPTVAGSCTGISNAWGVYVSGDYAYVADYYWGLRVVNITDPTHPSVAGSCLIPTPDGTRGVCVSGDYAYVASGYSGLQVVNITDPTHPSLAGSCTTPNQAYGVSVSGDYAYVADYNAGPQVVNITDPIHPSLVGSYANNPDHVYSVYVSGDYAYVAAGLSGLRVVEVQANRYRGHVSSATAQSLTVYDGYSLTHATLQATETQSLYTSTAYYLSADGGLHWEAATSGIQHDFENSGTQLCWRAVLSTADSVQSPILSTLSIAYNVKLDAPTLTSPGDGLGMGDSAPLLHWTDPYVGLGYLVEVDTVASFNSDNLINVTVPMGWKNCTTPTLPDGLWFWRVAANDTGGDLGFFSVTWSMTIDTTRPTWDQTPTSKVVEFRTPFRYDLYASDPSGISRWWVNDTVHFAIDSSGVITNRTSLAVGVYPVQVWVNDTCNNVQTAEFFVIVWDRTSPSLLGEPADRTVEFCTPFRYDLNASDPSGISRWWINDTAHFAIDSSGVVTNVTLLAVGVYGIQVWVSDAFNNVQTAEFSVTVQDTTSPYWLVEPPDITLDYGEPLDYQLQVADLSGISRYEINDTAHFSVDAAGYITSSGTLGPGIYGVLVTVYDPYGNYLTGAFSVTVLEQQTTTTTTTTTSTTGNTTPPTTTPTTSAPPDLGILALVVGGIGGVAILVIIVVYMKRRSSP